MQESNGGYTLEQSKIKLARGGETSLVYALPTKEHEPTTCVIIAHGAGGPMYSPFVRFFHTELAKQGYVTLRFNFPYMEARRKVPDRTDVLEASYQSILDSVMNGKHRTNRVIIGGKSMGGRIASQVAAKNAAEVNGLFFLGYPLHRPGNTDELRDAHLYKIKKPMLFLSGTRDNFARKDLLEGVVRKIGANAQLKWIENGDHSFKTSSSKTEKADGTKEALVALLEWLHSIP